MAIDPAGLSSTPLTNTRTRLEGSGQSQAGKGQQQDSDTTTKSGSVTLSSQGQMLQKLEEQAGQLPEVDSERVESIRKAIEDGSFSPSAERTAAAMLDLEEQIFG